MTVFTDVDLKTKTEAVLDSAGNEGVVCIRRGDGREYVLRPLNRNKSPLNIGFADVRPTRKDVVDAVREGRDRD